MGLTIEEDIGQMAGAIWYALNTHGEVSLAQLKKLVGGPETAVNLTRHIPVNITYFTAWVNDDGSLATFGDVYGHDARMVAALFRGAAAFDAPTGAITASASPGPPIEKRTRQTDAQSGFARFLSRGAD